MSNAILPNASYQQTLDRPSVHVFTNIISTDLADLHNVNVNIAFPVREVIVRATYTITCNRGGSNYAVVPCVYLTSSYPCFESNIMLGLGASVAYRPETSLAAYNDYWVLCGNFSNTNLSFKLRQPQMLMGSIPFQIAEVRPVANELFDIDLVLDLEFVG